MAVQENGTDPCLRRAARTGDIVDSRADFDVAIAVVGPVAESLLDRLRSMTSAPDAVQVEFGVALSLKAGAFIASSTAEANFEIQLSWSRRDGLPGPPADRARRPPGGAGIRGRHRGPQPDRRWPVPRGAFPGRRGHAGLRAQLGHRGVEYLRNVRGVALLGLGRIEEAAAEFRTCREAGHVLVHDRLEGISGVNLAWALLLLDRRDEVGPVARAAAERLEASATAGADGALAIAQAVEGAAPAAALQRARKVLRGDPHFHRPSDEDLERLAARLASR